MENNIDEKSLKKNKSAKAVNHFPSIAFLAFLIFAVIFSYLRNDISAFNAWVLRNIGRGPEVDQATLFKKKSAKEDDKKKAGNVTAANASKTVQKNKPKPKPAPQPKPKPKPKFVAKTETPIVTLLPKGEKSSVVFPKCPPLRMFNGNSRGFENTDIILTSDGKKLIMLAVCYDHKPEEIIVSNSEKNGPGAAFQDDSMELFLMKDRDSDYYFQYVCSASGANKTYHMRNDKKKSNAYEPLGLPDGFVEPKITADLYNKGYKVYMEINLCDIGIDQLKDGDTFLIQVVRNYRGQYAPNHKVMQLFPNYAYGTREENANNHERKSFQPVTVISAEKLEKK